MTLDISPSIRLEPLTKVFFRLGDALGVLAAVFFEIDHVLDAVFSAHRQIFHPLAEPGDDFAQAPFFRPAHGQLVFQGLDAQQILADVGDVPANRLRFDFAQSFGLAQVLLLSVVRGGPSRQQDRI